ncbi:hypothetical protein H4S14_001952 [Agrobacterium vitis]|nr:hypothetical protein [Agrobacterium vitis]MBE1438207.1 hypothetical protein [Agrobacterium vitis]
MSTWSARVLALLAILSCCQICASTEAAESSFGECRQQLLKGNDPNGSGSWVLLERTKTPTLCISGSLEGVDTAQLTKTVLAHRELDVSVRSTGGPVAIWLTLAEHMIGRVRTLYVDEACFSSCANYLLPIASHVLAPKNSLIVWHGGPNAKTEDFLKGADVEEAIAYDNLSDRTRALYERAKVKTSVLSFTAQPPSETQERWLRKADQTHVPVSGYALSPRRLETCFGFRNLEGMWHAGGDPEVFSLGRKRSSRLALLESPEKDDGVSSCFNRLLKKSGGAENEDVLGRKSAKKRRI